MTIKIFNLKNSVGLSDFYRSLTNGRPKKNISEIFPVNPKNLSFQNARLGNQKNNYNLQKLTECVVSIVPPVIRK